MKFDLLKCKGKRKQVLWKTCCSVQESSSDLIGQYFKNNFHLHLFFFRAAVVNVNTISASFASVSNFYTVLYIWDIYQVH